MKISRMIMIEVAKYHQYENELSDDGLVYPVSPTDKKMLRNFEDRNKLLINILGLAEENEMVVYRSSRTKHQNDDTDISG